MTMRVSLVHLTQCTKTINMKKVTKKKTVKKEEQVIKLDLGCGINKRQDGNWIGVDVIKFDGVDVVLDLGKKKWPWADNSVTEIHASHFVEHLVPAERIHFVNEVYRVLKKPEYNTAGGLASGFATIIVPHWASQRAYGDLTHAWPPVSEFWFYYLDRDWRAVNAPHNQDYKCHLEVKWGYNTSPSLNGRNQEYVQNALQNYKEAASDMVAQMCRKD